jgi:MFS family permease
MATSSKLLDINLNPDERTLRQFGFIALGGFGLLAVCAFYEKWMFAFGLGEARSSVAIALAAVAGVAALFSLVYPKANKVIYVGITILAYPIGFVLSYVIMGVLFFGIFAPIGALLRMSGVDPMQRALEKAKQSYWSEARAARSKESYFRQF